MILPPYNVTYVCNVGANPTASPFRILLPDFPAEDCLCHWITHYVCYHLCVTNTNYHRTLFEAKQDLARCLVKRQKLDHKIARLQAVISDLHNLCAELDQKSFEKRVDRVIKADQTKGITELSRVILKEKFFPMTTSELKASMEARKLNLSGYSNPMAVIHTVLKRLVQGGEVRVVSQAKGKKAYQWVSTADKLLSELRQTSTPGVQKRGGLTESK